MQIAQEVHNVHYDKKRELSYFRIPFVEKGSKPKITKQQAADRSKMAWAARLGIGAFERGYRSGSPDSTASR